MNDTTDDQYVDYQHYIDNDFVLELFSLKNETPNTVKELQDSAALLTDDAMPGDSILTATPGAKILNDEEIYARRKKSVFLIGKSLKRKDTTGNIHYDFIGSAFAISGDGICVTNYHVLEGLIRKNDSIANIDSTYFIETFDKEIYFIEKVLAYSQNNDLAIFKVNTRGGKLQPLAPGKPAREGAEVYCISNPQANFYYFTKGMVARNSTSKSQLMVEGRYNPAGNLPIRMEITADYGAGSSGAPILDKYGNLIGIVSATVPVGKDIKNSLGNSWFFQQMVIKQAIPVKALLWLLN
jgi:serine protease Do